MSVDIELIYKVLNIIEIIVTIVVLIILIRLRNKLFSMAAKLGEIVNTGLK